MAVVVKTSTIADGEWLTVRERGYLDPHVSSGTLAYIWSSETDGGEGLSVRGIVEEAELDGVAIRLRIRLIANAPQRHLTKATLAPHRDDNGETPLATLAHKLYRHAHNKIVELSPSELAFIDAFFETRSNPRIRQQA